jgi:parvulin-like peptidyl-prolyl isomerase
MARRERTTGLPRPRPRTRTRERRRVAGVPVDETQIRLGILGAAALLLLLVLGMFVYRWYDNTYARPHRTVLRVADEKFSLGYYADRLIQYVQAVSQSGVGLPVAEQQLVTQLETEALTELVARDKGVTVNDTDITNDIANGLGVPVGGSGSSFDTLYRQRLASLKMSDGNYRRLTEAAVYRDKLIEAYKTEIGTAGETVTIRKIVVQTKEAADALLVRINAGEDFGTIAQTESADLASRQQDGLQAPEPPVLLPENIRTAIDGKSAGPDVFGPTEVSGSYWLFKIDKRDPAGTISDTQAGQMADLRLADDLKAKRATTTIKRSLSSSDIKWAEDNAD